jgi:hypothetical protein
VVSGGVILGNAAAEQTTFQMRRSDVRLRAKFDFKSYNLAITDDTHGSAAASVAGTTVSRVKAGVTVNLNAVPKIDAVNDYMFDRWTVESGSPKSLIGATDEATGNGTGSFVMPEGDVGIKADFRLREYPITLTNDGKGRGVTNEGLPTSPADRIITLTAEPNEGYEFVGWKVLGGGVTLAVDPGNPLKATFTMPRREVSVRAEFRFIPVPPYILFLDDNGRLAAGQWYDPVTGTGTVTRDNLLYVKAGSLVMFTTPPAVTTEMTWSASRSWTKFFNPSLVYTDNSWPYYVYGTINGKPITEVPGMNQKVSSSLDLSSDAYNLNAAARDGYGDPCRLIGLTQEEGRALNDQVTLLSRNSGFRMPSKTTMSAWASATTGGAIPSTWTTVNGTPGRWINGDIKTFLPAGGYRIGNSGKVTGVDTDGVWWSSNPGGFAGYISTLLFDETSSVMETWGDYNGSNIRCEPK